MRYKLIFALFLILLSSFLIGKGTIAYFTDTSETGVITFETGSIELARADGDNLKTEVYQVDRNEDGEAVIPASVEKAIYPSDIYEIQVDIGNSGSLTSAMYGRLQLVKDLDVVLKDTGQADKLSNHVSVLDISLALQGDVPEERDLLKDWYGVESGSIPLKNTIDGQYRYACSLETGESGTIKVRLQLNPQADFIPDKELQDSLGIEIDIKAIQDDSESRAELQKEQGE